MRTTIRRITPGLAVAASPITAHARSIPPGRSACSSTGSPSRSRHACAQCDYRAMPRFLTLADVAEILNVSAAQAYALVRSGEVPAIQVGGRGQWRVEEQRLEDYINAKYAETAARFIDA